MPLGGYVKIYGQEEDKKSKESYSERPVWQRLIVIVAGVVMNFLFASLLFFALLSGKGFVDNLDYSILDTEKQLPVFGTVKVLSQESPMYSYPASEAELEYYPDLSWDEAQKFPSYIAKIPSFGMITHVNGEKLKDTEDFSNIVKENIGNEITLTIVDAGEEIKDYVVTVSEDGLVGIYWLSTEQVEVSYPSLLGKLPRYCP